MSTGNYCRFITIAVELLDLATGPGISTANGYRQWGMGWDRVLRSLNDGQKFITQSGKEVSDSASTIMARAQDARNRILLNSYLLIGADIVS
ncbi:hypothetical protein ABHI18_011406 [Aspergillus niger]